MYCHGASELEHNRFTQFNLSALSKREKSFMSKPPAVFCLISQGFQLFCKVADILLKAPDVNVFLAP